MICQTFKVSLNVVDFIPIQVLIHSKETFGANGTTNIL